ESIPEIETVTSTLFTATTSSPFDQSVIWVLVVGMILGFLLAAAMGANDVANTFGTTVGSGTLTLSQAYILASFFEALGAIFVGWSVTDTLRKGVVDSTMFADSPKELMIGQIAALGGCATWLALATLLGMPVSTTQSIVGGTLGYSLVLRGLQGIRWKKLLHIVMSWFISPLTSGAISSMLYVFVDVAVLRRENPFVWGMRLLPVFYFLCISFNVFIVTWKGSKLLHFDRIPFWASFLVGIGSGLIAAVIGLATLSMCLIKSHFSIMSISSKDISLPGSRTFYDLIGLRSSHTDDHKTLQLFAAVQVFTACFAGFAHGAQDISNAVAPVATVISIYSNKSPYQKEEVHLFIDCIGLWTFGDRVITTIATKVSKINAASGFTIEFGAALTSLLASRLGLPISTTHCLVGSVVAVGCVRSSEPTKWSLLRNIAMSWILTIPASGIYIHHLCPKQYSICTFLNQ
ncbi:unnamed protein product, partial [Angiostrongylus costaricensis]|uniref:Phosphate transporter n=1 Tax=Angiostrongylus costaricensis TaxID=334426 RepID=A0A158PKB4_ANGCS